MTITNNNRICQHICQHMSVYTIIMYRCVDVFYIIVCVCSCIRHSSETILRQDFGWWSTSTDLCVPWSKKCPSGGDKYSHLLPHTGKYKLNSSFSLLRVAEVENSTLKALVSKQCHITYMYCVHCLFRLSDLHTKLIHWLVQHHIKLPPRTDSN